MTDQPTNQQLDEIKRAVAATFDQHEPAETRQARWEAAALAAGREVDRNALRAYMAVADAEQHALADNWARSVASTDAEVRRLRDELKPYEMLAPQQCPAGKHADWLVDSEYAHACPWCEIEKLRAANGEGVARKDCPCKGTAHADDCEVYLELLRTTEPTPESPMERLAARWEQLAEHGDTAIGHFEGPAAVTLNAEVEERGRVYRQAAADLREALTTGRLPRDLMTRTERAAAVPAVETGR